MNLQSEFAATLVDEWARAGIRHAVVAPGSRSSPLAVALLADGRIEVHVRLDERSAGFFALGIGLADGRPCVMVTTSGTAAAEVHAAVVEADLASVPLLIVTADRPPELHTVGAPQTIEQTRLYGSSVRYGADIGVPDEANRPFWRSLAARVVAETLHGACGPGPVHLNVPLREPLLGEIGVLPAPAGTGAWHAVASARGPDETLVARFVELVAPVRRGVFMVGGNLADEDPDAIVALAYRLGWPVLGDARVPKSRHSSVVAYGDSLLRTTRALSDLCPDLVVRVGSPPASRVVEAWLASLVERGVPQVLLERDGRFEDPSRAAGEVFFADLASLAHSASTALTAHNDDTWLSLWRQADDAAEAVIERVLHAEARLSEPAIARAAYSIERGAALVCSSSMPVRDIEWFAPRRDDPPRVYANRGANGIDGVVSTVLGVAAARAQANAGPTVGLVGDLAFLHDLSALVWGTYEDVPSATLVVVDNGGGGIFNFLGHLTSLDTEVFERGFGTPQRADLLGVVRSLGHEGQEVQTIAELETELGKSASRAGLTVLYCRTERGANVDLHARLNAEVALAVEALTAS